MARVVYVPKKFSAAHQQMIDQANDICEGYDAQGLSLTLRQLYYQFVARGLLPNQQTEYKRLGGIINDARLGGALDWEFLVDRTRNLVAPSTWASPGALLKSAAKQYSPDLWSTQHHRVEVWIEKDAGIGVIERVCADNTVPYFSCRGYTSASELWNAAQRIGNYLVRGERVTILHIGDHDPSGVDMTRDIKERLALFLTNDWNRSDHFRAQVLDYLGMSRNEMIRESMRDTIRLAGGTIGSLELPWRVRRIALTREQIEQYNPPPNPAKESDSRFQKYQEATGLNESWELDALDPFVLQNLIQEEIDRVRDDAAWGDMIAELDQDRLTLTNVSDNWDSVRAQYGEGNTS